MPGPLPHAFVEAAILAWPFASESAFRVGAAALREERAGVLDRDTDRLAHEMIEYLRPRTRGTSVEILRQLQESVWFAEYRRPAGPTSVPLETLLGIAAERLLQFQAGRAVLRVQQLREHQAMARWRWMSLALPADLLIAAHGARVQQEPSSDHVTVMPAYLWSLLDETLLANTHLHFGASVPFEVLWTNLITRVGTDPHDHRGLDRGGPAPLGGAHPFLSWLVAGALARTVLAGYLWQWETRRTDAPDALMTYAGLVSGRTAEPGLLMQALNALYRGSDPPSYTRTRPLLRRLAPTTLVHVRAQPREAVARADPVARWLGAGGALPETRFLFRALRRLQMTPPDDHFARLFWQYVRLRGVVYRHVVQEPGTSGLDWFTTHFNRMRPLRGRLSDAVMASALELESRTGRLESLEVRTAPAARWATIRSLVEQVAWTPSPARACPERGLVLHYLKEQRPDERRAEHGDPRQTAYGCRFGAYYAERHSETLAIERLLRFHPESLVILRGVDVCSVELSQPTWVFLPLVARLRTASLKASASLAPFGRIPPLRVTMHAGEDFRRLTEGLRRIHEPIEFGAVQHGDRLGHAVALGIPPARWAEYADAAPQPAIERLDDLLWEVARYRAGDLPADAARVERIRGEIESLARLVYNRPCPLEDLLRARELRHAPAVLDSIGYPFLRGKQAPDGDPALALLWQYLTSADVYLRGERPVSVTSDDGELRMLDEAQCFLRRTLSMMPVVVEANPSSNMLIGELSLADHPAFRLYPLPGVPTTDGSRVPVALGDDDPVTFATTLADEIGHLYFALVGRNVSSLDAQEWLRGIAANGMRAKFTLGESKLPGDVARDRGPTWTRSVRRW